MVLILHGTGTDGHIGEDIGQITIILGVEHLIGGSETGLSHGTDVHLSHRHQSCKKVRLLLGIRLMDDPLVALTGGAGLVGVDSGDQDQLVLHLLADLGQTIHIITDRILIVCGAGADDHQKLAAFSGEYGSDLCVSPGLHFCQFLGERKHFLDLCGSG